MSLKTPISIGLLVLLATRTAVAQVSEVDPATSGPAWSPYLAGGLLGVLSMLTFYFSNKPLGASTAYARLAGLLGQAVAKEHTESLTFYAEKKEPQLSWQIMLIVGVVLGAFLAAWSGGELTGRWLPPMWIERFGESVWLRLAFGFFGGGLMAFGARVAGGCTSGHGISGALQLSVGSWLSLIGFFIGGVIAAMLLFYL